MVWTDEQVSRLREMRSRGFSATLIAEAIGEGCTRNAVIGKAFRLGLPRLVAHRVPREKPRVIKLRAAPRPPSPDSLGLNSGKHAAPLRKKPDPIHRIPDGKGVPFPRESMEQCAYLYADDECCGLPRVEGSMFHFCEYHRSICLIPPDPRKSPPPFVLYRRAA